LDLSFSSLGLRLTEELKAQDPRKDIFASRVTSFTHKQHPIDYLDTYPRALSETRSMRLHSVVPLASAIKPLHEQSR
jgi:hypothetical protein